MPHISLLQSLFKILWPYNVRIFRVHILNHAAAAMLSRADQVLRSRRGGDLPGDYI